ncbi:hypothetical protein GOP47_0026617 [Adiantum capillus-veneris]|nr:hypothetical protein GOP47_0026617 [Adiantum capillus-veneris]
MCPSAGSWSSSLALATKALPLQTALSMPIIPHSSCYPLCLDDLGQIYSSDAEVVAAIASFVPFFATSSAFDALQAVLPVMLTDVCARVIRGAEWQKAGLPTGYLLAFAAHLQGKAKSAAERVGDCSSASEPLLPCVFKETSCEK